MFNVPSYDLLGHLISEAGVSTDPAKLQDIRDQPTPASKKDVRTFLGLTGYYRNFVKDYTRIALPLVEMTKDSAPVPFVWTPEAEDTFQQIIGAFLKSTFLAKYDPNKVTHLITDASTEAYGGHIEQEGRPLCFFSGKFDSAQRNWATTLTCLAAHKMFPHLLLGKTIWFADHQVLKALRTMLADSARRVMWRQTLNQFPFTIEKRPSKDMHVDGLARHLSQDKSTYPILNANRFTPVPVAAALLPFPPS